MSKSLYAATVAIRRFYRLYTEAESEAEALAKIKAQCLDVNDDSIDIELEIEERDILGIDTPEWIDNVDDDESEEE